MKKIVKVLSLILSVSMLFTMTACGGEGQQVNKKELPDYDAKKDQLGVEIAGWVVPDNFDDTQIQYVKEAGVNALFFVSAGAYSFQFASPTETNFSDLDKLHKEGINNYIFCGSKQGYSLRDVDKYKGNPAVTGVVLDEPNRQQIMDIAANIDYFNEVGGNLPLYVNLYPSASIDVQNDFKNEDDIYEAYLKFYVDNVLLKTTSDFKMLSADRYPLTYNQKGEKALDSAWLHDVQDVAKVAREYEGVDIKTNFFIQTMSYTSGGKHTINVPGSRDRVPDYYDIRMQEYALMAFGYDSISLFCYGTPAVSGHEFIEDSLAMIDREGQKTQIYEDCKKANFEILEFDHVIQQFELKGNFASDKDVLLEGKPRKTNIGIDRISLDATNSLVSVLTSQDTLFGYFMDNEENEGFMVVNYNETTKKLSDTVTMNFNPANGFNKARVYVEGKPVVKDIVKNSLTLDLGIGEGVFVIPYCA